MSLSPDRIRRMFNYDPNTGALTWAIKPSQAVNIGDEAGHWEPKGRRVKIDYETHAVSVIVWLWVYGCWPAGYPKLTVVDHINRNRFDNRIDNLRLVTSKQNSLNKGEYKNNTTGIKGVSLHRDGIRYQAYIRVSGVAIYLGLFNTIEEAAEARRKAEEKYHDPAR